MCGLETDNRAQARRPSARTAGRRLTGLALFASSADNEVETPPVVSVFFPAHGGGDRRRVELRELVAEPVPEEVLAVHEALDELEQEDPLKAQIVNLRYFTGMTVPETARVLGLSERTLHRHWAFIKAWLKRRLRGPDDPA